MGTRSQIIGGSLWRTEDIFSAEKGIDMLKSKQYTSKVTNQNGKIQLCEMDKLAGKRQENTRTLGYQIKNWVKYIFRTFTSKLNNYLNFQKCYK
jgi:hypothetical protein